MTKDRVENRYWMGMLFIVAAFVILGVLLLPRIGTAAESPSLVMRSAEYSRELSRIERSPGPISIEALLKQGDDLAADLKKIIEQFTAGDYAAIQRNLRGYIVNREEVILVEPDIRSFAGLAARVGTEQDLLYFSYMLKVKPEGYWPVYLMRQTDFGGCTDFGNGVLSVLYKEGSAIAPRLAGYYRLQVDRTIEDIADKIAAGQCACGSIATVKRELQTFLEMNPQAPITDRVKARIEAVNRGISIRENCIGGI